MTRNPPLGHLREAQNDQESYSGTPREAQNDQESSSEAPWEAQNDQESSSETPGKPRMTRNPPLRHTREAWNRHLLLFLGYRAQAAQCTTLPYLVYPALGTTLPWVPHPGTPPWVHHPAAPATVHPAVLHTFLPGPVLPR